MTVDLDRLPSIPRDAEGPVFKAPWEASAFAMTVKLYESGFFTWTEWAETLAEEITRAQQGGDPDLGDTYYRHWLAALERLVQQKGIVSGAELVDRRDAWDAAVRATPHGQPIELKR
ncbi:MAG: nitrile hydratase accessory protein [Alphaproteobacteria bacterium]